MFFIIALCAIILNSYACASDISLEEKMNHLETEEELSKCIQKNRANNADPSAYTNCIASALIALNKPEESKLVQDPDFFTEIGIKFTHEVNPERFAEGLSRILKITNNITEELVLNSKLNQLLTDAKNALTEEERNELMKQADAVTAELIESNTKKLKYLETILDNTIKVYPEVYLLMTD